MTHQSIIDILVENIADIGDVLLITTPAGHRLYFEDSGEGFPVLMITGMASTMDWFAYNIPAFACHHRVIAQDLRGSNRDGVDPAGGAYDTRDMAADSVAILDSLSIERAHVVGLSLGGMIAQWLAIDHADRVARMSLVANGLARVPDAFLSASQDIPEPPTLTTGQRAQAILDSTFTADFTRQQPEKWQFFHEAVIEKPPHPATERAQIAASMRHDTTADLPRVQSRSQVLVGDLDVINATGAPELAAGMGCQATVLPGMSHGLNVEFSEHYNRLVLDFLNAE